MPITLTAMSRAINVDISPFRRALVGTNATRILEKMGFLIPKVEDRELVFTSDFHYITPENPIFLAKLAKNWSLWARCVICGDNKFLPLEIDGKEHVACYHCFPPGQYKSIGGARVKKSLIHEALKNII